LGSCNTFQFWLDWDGSNRHHFSLTCKTHVSSPSRLFAALVNTAEVDKLSSYNWLFKDECLICRQWRDLCSTWTSDWLIRCPNISYISSSASLFEEPLCTLLRCLTQTKRVIQFCID
jgi:hypothetical protein